MVTIFNFGSGLDVINFQPIAKPSTLGVMLSELKNVLTRTTISIIAALVVVVMNGLIGHFFSPNGINFTPIVLTATTSLVCFGAKSLRPFWKSILTYCFIGLNDILLKLYAGGVHDIEGLGWMQLFLFIGLVPASGILIVSIIKTQSTNAVSKIFAILLTAALLVIHSFLFGHLGLGRYYWYKWNG